MTQEEICSVKRQMLIFEHVIIKLNLFRMAQGQSTVYVILKHLINQFSENSEKPRKSVSSFELCCYGQKFYYQYQNEVVVLSQKVSYSFLVSVWCLEHSMVSNNFHRIIRSFINSNTLRVVESSRKEYVTSIDEDQGQNIKEIYIQRLR